MIKKNKKTFENYNRLKIWNLLISGINWVHSYLTFDFWSIEVEEFNDRMKYAGRNPNFTLASDIPLISFHGALPQIYTASTLYIITLTQINIVQLYNIQSLQRPAWQMKTSEYLRKTLK